ncbi:mitochondrial f1f0 atp synthase subunit f protein [Apiospora arundinis]
MLLALVPRIVTICVYRNIYSGHYPRGWPDDVQILPADTLSPKIRGRLFRADAAMQNSIENLPLFAAAVVAGNASFLPTAELNLWCIAYLLLRILYMSFYVFLEDNPKFVTHIRSLIWAAGVAVEMYPFVLSASRMSLVVVNADGTEVALLTRPGMLFSLSGTIGKQEL